MALAAFLLIGSFAGAQSCTDTWTNTAGGPWDTGSNWSTGKAPTSTDTVCITAQASQPYTVTVGNETIDVAGLTVGATGAPATLQMGNSGGGTLTVDVTGAIEVQSGGTIDEGWDSSFTAGSIVNSGTLEVENAGVASLTAGDVTNTGTFAVDGAQPLTVTLDGGSTFDNQGGTISNGASSTVDFGSPSGQSATLELDSGGTVTNSGSMTYEGTLAVDGGSICGNTLELGAPSGGSSTLAFAEQPGLGPACAGNANTDQIEVLNVNATLSGTIPSAYTVDLGQDASSFFTVALAGDVVNDGTLVPGFGGDAGTISSAAASDYLSNNGTLTFPVGGAFNAPLVNTGQVSIEGAETGTLVNGEAWDNAEDGTITVGASDSLEFTGGSGAPATLALDTGSAINNSGTLRWTGNLDANGGSLCGNPALLGLGDGNTSAGLQFPSSGTFTSTCSGGATDNTFAIQNNPATLSGTIPAGVTVTAGADSGNSFNVALSGDVINDGTFEPGFGGDAGTVSAAAASDYLTNNGTVTVPDGSAANLDVPLVNNGSLTIGGSTPVETAATAVLQDGWTWENTDSGTISLGSGEFFTLSSQSGTPAVKLESGSTLDNAGTLHVNSDVVADGGSVCGNPVLIGPGDGTTEVGLAFPSTPGTGPACASGSTNNTFAIQNDPATLSGTIPAGVTVTAGDDGGSSFDVELDGPVVNDGTFEPGFDGDAGTVSAASSSDTLTNNGAITIPDGSAAALDIPLTNNGSLTYGGSTGVEFPPATTLATGYDWDNTSTGTIAVGSGETFDIESPSDQSATFTQDGLIDNAGTFNVADPIDVTGGAVCDDPLNLGLGDTGASPGTTLSLTFGSSPSAGGLACGSDQATDQLNIYNVTATLNGSVPAGYTIAMGNGGSGFANVTTPATFTNAGTLEPEGGATVSVGSSGSGTLTNTGTIEIPAVGDESAATIAGGLDNTTGTVELTEDALLTVTGSYSQGSGGTFTPDIDGTSAEGGYGLMDAEGGSTLAGTLNIDTVSGFDPTSGNTFKVLYGGAVSGTFGTVYGQYPPPNTSAYGVTYDADDVTLNVTGQSTTPLTVDESGDGTGTVTSSPTGIDCGPVCNAGFAQDQNVTLTETPASGSVFTGWSGGGCTGTGTTCEVTLSTSQTVNASFITPTASTTTLTSSSEPSVTGQQVEYTATVSPAPSGGSMAFTDGGSAISGCGGASINSSTGVATCTPTYDAIGSHSIQATYSGDTSELGSSSQAQIQVVDPANPTLQLQASPNPGIVDHQVQYTASLSTTVDGGTVAFTDGGQTITNCGSVAITSGDEATCDVTYSAIGSHTVEAAYTGDTNYGAAQTTPLDEGVTTAATGIDLGSSSNPSSPGQQVTYTATVTEQSGGAPVTGGTVTFYDGGAGIDNCYQVPINSSNGEATCSATYDVIGSHSITADYSGDTLDSSTSGSVEQNVSKTQTGTALQSSDNPSLTGDTVTFTATISPIPDGGTVAFSDDNSPISDCAAVTVNTSDGEATCQVTYNQAGSHTIQAQYSGDTLYAGSTSEGLNQVVGTTTTSLASSANPSLPTTQVTYTAAITPIPDGGTVTFTDNNSDLACDPVTVDTTTGKATCAVTYNSIGSHAIVATYSGDTNFPGSVSSTLTQTVAQETTSASVQSSANPSTVDQRVTYTATLSPAPDGGTVNFTDNGNTINNCGTVAVNTTTGEETCSFTYTSTGSHTIAVMYSGDTYWAGAQSQGIDQGVDQVSTGTSVKSSLNPSKPTSGPITYTATVSPTPDGGTIAFTDNGGTLSGCGAVAVSTTTGAGTCTTTYTAGGSHSILASYSGDTIYAGSSGGLTQSVSAPTPTTVTVTASPNPSAYYATQETTFTATVSPVPDGGTVSFSINGAGDTFCTGSFTVNTTTGQASCTISYFWLAALGIPDKAGPYPVTASYSGDASFASSQGSGTLNYELDPPTITISAVGGTPVVGQSVFVETSVAAAPFVGGTVSLSGNGAPIAACQGMAASAGLCFTSFSTAGNHTLTATYSGYDYDGAGTATTTIAIAAQPTQTVVVQPAQPSVTVPVTACTGYCIASPEEVLPPTFPPPPPCCLGGAADLGANATSKAQPSLDLPVTKPLTQGQASKLAAGLQSYQNTLIKATSATVASALPASGCPTLPSSSIKSGGANFLGPNISAVLADVYAANPSKADFAALVQELGLADAKSYSPARTFARCALVDAIMLGEATLAHQLGYHRLSQLHSAHLSYSLPKIRVKRGQRLLTITPSGTAGRVLRLVELIGLDRRVTIKIVVTETGSGHHRVLVRTLRVR